MSIVSISLLIGIAAGAWLFNHFQRTSGGNTRRSIIAATITAALVFAGCTLILFIL